MDAISTALIMENKEVVSQIVDHIKTINFNQTVQGGESVSLFETTIRYLGGLVSGNSSLLHSFFNIILTEMK